MDHRFKRTPYSLLRCALFWNIHSYTSADSNFCDGAKKWKLKAVVRNAVIRLTGPDQSSINRLF